MCIGATTLSLSILPAFHGDAILISYGNSQQIHILVDTGPKKAYSRGVLKDVFSQSNGINLLILTHVDEDHIGGVLSYYEDSARSQYVFKEVWFNAGTTVSRLSTEVFPPETGIPLQPGFNLKMSINQGITLEMALSKDQIWNKKVFFAGQSVNFFGAELIFLSPDPADLQVFSRRWPSGDQELEMASWSDRHRSIAELVDLPFLEQGSPANRSSLAFLFSFAGKRILFMGDAFPSVIVKYLKQLGFSIKNKLILDYVKVSHHGSRYGMSPELLSMIDCEHFIISTDGTRGLPSKECLARIIYSRNEGVQLHFNYDNAMIRGIFSEVDYSAHPFKLSFPEQVGQANIIPINI